MDEILKLLLASLSSQSEEMKKRMEEPSKRDIVTLSFGSFMIDSCYVTKEYYETVVFPCDASGKVCGDLIHAHKEGTSEKMMEYHDTLVTDLIPIIKAYVLTAEEV